MHKFSRASRGKANAAPAPIAIFQNLFILGDAKNIMSYPFNKETYKKDSTDRDHLNVT